MSAPADERYIKSIEFMEKAMNCGKKENLVLRYNWCMLKLHYANCVLQKLSRNIPRTSEEVKNVLKGLEESLKVVEQILKWSKEKRKIPISSSLLQDFVINCRNNINSAQGHLTDELKKEEESRELVERQRAESERKVNERNAEIKQKKEMEARRRLQKERKAQDKLDKVGSLVGQWRKETRAAEAKKAKKARKVHKFDDEFINDEQIVEEDSDSGSDKRESLLAREQQRPEPKRSKKSEPIPSQEQLFGEDDSDDEVSDKDSDKDSDKGSDKEEKTGGNLKKRKAASRESDSEDDAMFDEHRSGENDEIENADTKKPTHKDLFGDSSGEESDEELVPEKQKKKKKRISGGENDKNIVEDGSDENEENAVKKR
eukprot:CAMPEP_0113325498 /NCGR_PEP_ID=MMETSP0010_2-20120614/17815_1 /TAXON_ID=216773 ORGANISM="Corethron hystrix, Strain 308" /NCGR_SAMPLE_ID=MMETSP0010_2 /ASSEMBLY_ACC=CAM_ASM_000155 /LENGTH=372 /DNA_ID=CAMNT_0000185357 /DNA_START=1212 /DNA_END=2326 /DNA_ORIENTATION=- /assembly_acc=CAM_ASM_000155